MKSKKLNRHKWIKIARKNFKPVSIGISCPRCFEGYIDNDSTEKMIRQYFHKTENVVISYFICPVCGYKKWKAIECTGDRATQMMSKDSAASSAP